MNSKVQPTNRHKFDFLLAIFFLSKIFFLPKKQTSCLCFLACGGFFFFCVMVGAVVVVVVVLVGATFVLWDLCTKHKNL